MAGTWKVLRRLADNVICCKHHKDWDADPSTPTAWEAQVPGTHEIIDDPDGSVMQKQLFQPDTMDENNEVAALIHAWKIVDGAWEAIP